MRQRANAHAELARELLERRVVDRSDLAIIAGSSHRSILRWTSGGSSRQRKSEHRLLELKAAVDAVDQALRSESTRAWLRSPNPSLDWRKPLDLIADGEGGRVVGAALALADGITA